MMISYLLSKGWYRRFTELNSQRGLNLLVAVFGTGALLGCSTSGINVFILVLFLVSILPNYFIWIVKMSERKSSDWLIGGGDV